MNHSSSLRIITASALITGNIIGAGILGLPICTGLSGFLPALIAMIVTWGLMLATAMILSGYALKSNDQHFDLPTLYGQTLGPFGRWIGVLANLLILYGLLVAYLSGGAKSIIALFDLPLSDAVVMIVFFIILTGLSLFGLAMVQRGNAALMVLMWIAFIVLLVMTGKNIKTENLSFTNWPLLPASLPIMVTAFHFHNIIPTICRSLNSDPGAVKKALLTGSLIGFLMNFLWIFVVLGTLPATGEGETTLLYAFNHGQPATVPLSKMIGSPFFTQAGLLFALLAIMTSYLANSTALMSFIRDMVRGKSGPSNRILVAALTFGPPLAVALYYPSLFLKALDIVGGVGIALLFGVLPGLLTIQQASSGRRRAWGCIIVVFFLLVLCYEILQETGLLHIDPSTEIWKNDLGK
jgi:tyrosine-specific transport protein